MKSARELVLKKEGEREANLMIIGSEYDFDTASPMGVHLCHQN